MGESGTPGWRLVCTSYNVPGKGCALMNSFEGTARLFNGSNNGREKCILVSSGGAYDRSSGHVALLRCATKRKLRLDHDITYCSRSSQY